MKLYRERIEELRDWIVAYVASFNQDSSDVALNFRIKREHTFRVRDEMVGIGVWLGLGERDMLVAEVSALLHDIGRFEQYHCYRTFMDCNSADHAELGLEIIAAESLLEWLEQEDAEAVTEAIRNHNRLYVCDRLSGRNLLFALMLRDADKLDIWNVVLEYYEEHTDNPAVKLDLADDNEVSEKVLRDLLAYRLADKRDFRRLNDFKLNQLAWIYDLNFPGSCERARERGFLPRVFRHIKPLRGVNRVYARSMTYLYGKGVSPGYLSLN